MFILEYDHACLSFALDKFEGTCLSNPFSYIFLFNQARRIRFTADAQIKIMCIGYMPEDNNTLAQSELYVACSSQLTFASDVNTSIIYG